MDDVRGPDPADPARLTRMNRLATEARLVAGLAHELNNSLQVVGGLVELLATRTDLPSDAVARLEKVSGQTDKATSAIRRVVGYSRERPAELALVDLASVVDQALALRQYQLGRLGVAAIVDRGPNGAYGVRADERQLTQPSASDDADRDAGTRASRGQRQRERSQSRDPGSDLPALFLDEPVRARTRPGPARQPRDRRSVRRETVALRRHAGRDVCYGASSIGVRRC
jgi:hypothetical protein